MHHLGQLPCGVCHLKVARSLSPAMSLLAKNISDCHFRIGGAAGSQLQVAQCPKLSGAVNPNCIAGSMLLHMTPRSSGYLENIWAWVADHDLDSGPAQTQINIYVARGRASTECSTESGTNSFVGVLIETKAATWLYGTASEHCIFYQYSVMNAKNLYMGMVCLFHTLIKRLLRIADPNGISLLLAKATSTGTVHQPSGPQRSNLQRLPYR